MTLDQFTGINAGYVLELYERYQADPASVDPATRQLFERWQPSEAGPAAAGAGVDVRKVVGATNLVSCIRRFGHLAEGGSSFPGSRVPSGWSASIR